jgi:tRNA-Thr(GGU) m(6)t(6)A37 methyltransferase TsaA
MSAAPGGSGEAGGYALRPIGRVESPLSDRDEAPRQADEGAPGAWLAFDEAVLDGLRDLRPGDEVLLLTWLHHARRDVLRVHPRSDPSRPEQGVFSTRSPDRPNPIGLHLVEVLSRDDRRLQVRNLEALDGTPVIDLKPVLPGVADA